MDPSLDPWIAALALGGVLAGLTLLRRGLIDYQTTMRVADTATSALSSLAAGEVRVSGVIEVAEMTLVSLLQSVRCVHYRAAIGRVGDLASMETGFNEERSIGFRVRDATGSIRVFPRGARIDAPVRFDAATGAGGDEPPGLEMRTGGSTRWSEPDRSTAIADLLRVHEADDPDLAARLRPDDRRRTYRETRLEPGDAVTIVGRALPFSDLADPLTADSGGEANLLDGDPEVTADMAAARAAGILAVDPEAAWGNAAIPGFGVGRPISPPEIDPGARALSLATPEEAARAERTFAIAPETLVLASSAEVPLLVAYGSPGVVVERSRWRLLQGLLGAILAIASAMVLAIMVNGGVSR